MLIYMYNIIHLYLPIEMYWSSPYQKNIYKLRTKKLFK